MKALKILGLVVAGIVVLLAVLFALALTPSIQTWAVRKAVAGEPGTSFDVARLSLGTSRADVANLRYENDGMIVTAKSATARYSAWDFLTQQRIDADSVIIDDLVIDLRNANATAASQAPGTASPPRPSQAATQPDARSPRQTSTTEGDAAEDPFEGLLTEAKLPFDVRVASLVAKGRALLPGQQIVTFDIKGSGIETGKRGKLEWGVDFADSTAGADLRGLRSTGTANVHIAEDRRIDLVEIDAIATAMGPNLPSDRIQLTAKAEQPAAGGNEAYAANVSLLRGNSVEPIFKSDALYLAANREIAGAWNLTLRSEQLGALLSGLGLPQISANGDGEFSFKPDADSITATGNLQGETSQLEKVAPALAAVDAMRFAVNFDGGMANEIAQLNKLALEVTAADGRNIAQITTAQKIGYELATKRVTFADANAELARITVQALPLAWAQPILDPMIIESGDLSLALTVEAEPDGSSIRTRALEPLALRAVTLRSGDEKLLDQATLIARPSIDYSPTRVVAEISELNFSMPAGDAVTGRFTADITNLSTDPVIAFTSQLQAKIVAALKPYLPLDPGPLAIVSNTEGRLGGDVLQLAKASTTINREGGELIAAIEAQQPIRADLKASTFAPMNPQATAARVRLGAIPLAWAEPFVENSKFTGALAGGVLDITMRSADDLTLTTAEPIALRDAGAILDGKPMLQSIALTADLTATKRGETIAYEVRRIEVKQGQSQLAGLTVNGEAKLGETFALAARGNLEADVAALMNQPAFASEATLARGHVAAAFEASIADAMQAKATISAKNLVAKQDNRSLGDLELNLVANMKPNGSGTIALPITMTNAARKSDLSINGTFGKASDQKTFLFTGKIGSNHFVVDDFQPLAGLIPAGEAPPPPRPARDAEPIWKGVNGKVDVDLKRVVYGEDFVISAVRGTAVITDSRLSLEGLEGRLKENPFKLSGNLTFAPQQPKPYTLTAAADVQNLDVGEILRAANPDEKPALDAKANLTARLNGNAGNVGDLAKSTFGKFELSASEGVMRYLARKGRAAQAVDLLATGLAIFGAQKGSDTTVAVAELARTLNEVRFDNLQLQIERGADLQFKLTSLELISPILRLTGRGAIAAQQVENLENAPMNVMLQLGAKGELGFLLQRVGLLSGNQGPKGYQLMTRTFSIGGTPANPDSTALWKLLAEAAIGGLRGDATGR